MLRERGSLRRKLAFSKEDRLLDMRRLSGIIKISENFFLILSVGRTQNRGSCCVMLSFCAC